jgi:hypothetical protein
MREQSNFEERSTGAALLLTLLLVVAEAMVVGVVVLTAQAFGGGWVTVIAGVAAQIAVLSFVTLPTRHEAADGSLCRFHRLPFGIPAAHLSQLALDDEEEVARG